MPLLGSLALDDLTKTYIGKCPECQKIFSYTKYHRYVRIENNRQIVYCSYSCFRIRDKEDREKAKAEFEKQCEQSVLLERKYNNRQAAYYARRKALNGKSKEFPILLDKERAEAYICKAREKVTLYGKAWLGAEPGTKERDKARKSLSCWERKYRYAKERLEQLEAEDENV